VQRSIEGGTLTINEIIERSSKGIRPSIEDVKYLLSVRDGEREELFSAARRIRDEQFGRKVFVYGFVYFSTFCRNNCAFCYYRRNNKLDRYRKSSEEILALSKSLKNAGINLVDLTMGEDPFMCADDYKEMIDLIRKVKDEVGISVMVSPGAAPEKIFPMFYDAGADWFACYQETYNRSLFSKLRLEQDFDHRTNQKKWARESGMLTEDGMMVGLGETVHDRAEAIIKMGETGCEQIRAMTFVPQPGTPMSDIIPADSYDELTAIAVMRVLFPDRLIPASLDVEGISGLKTRIDAGANVITSIVPPNMDLAGVAQHELDIDNGNRSLDNVMRMLESIGRRVATNQEYETLLNDLKNKRVRP